VNRTQENRRPDTLAEAIQIIRETFPEQELAQWASMERSEALMQAHFELGLWIRNTWFYAGSCGLEDAIKSHFPYGPDVDRMSSYILEALWHILNGEPCPSLAELIGDQATDEDQ